MIPSLDDLIKMNDKALAVLNGSYTSLRTSLPGKDPDEKAEILAEMGRMSVEINVTTNVLIHLHAATTVVAPMSQETQRKLERLAESLDRAIMRQTWIDASLGIIQDLFDTATKLRKITATHT